MTELLADTTGTVDESPGGPRFPARVLAAGAVISCDLAVRSSGGGDVTVQAKVAAASHGGRSTLCGGELSLYTLATGGDATNVAPPRSAALFPYPPILSRTRLRR